MTEQQTTILTQSEIRDTVLEVIAEIAPNKDAEVTLEARLAEDLGFHSLGLLELAFALEDEFDLPPIDEATARQIDTPGRVADHVINSLSERGQVQVDGEPAP